VIVKCVYRAEPRSSDQGEEMVIHRHVLCEFELSRHATPGPSPGRVRTPRMVPQPQPWRRLTVLVGWCEWNAMWNMPATSAPAGALSVPFRGECCRFLSFACGTASGGGPADMPRSGNEPARDSRATLIRECSRAQTGSNATRVRERENRLGRGSGVRGSRSNGRDARGGGALVAPRGMMRVETAGPPM
jgi:hypothetical protein